MKFVVVLVNCADQCGFPHLTNRTIDDERNNPQCAAGYGPFCHLGLSKPTSKITSPTGFEHDPEVAVDVRIALLNEAAETGALLAAAHVAFPSIGHIAKNGESFRFVPVLWDY